MGTSIYSSVKDVSMQRGLSAVGKDMRRLCFTCNKPRLILGGKIDKRTRMWHCADCVALKGKAND